MPRGMRGMLLRERSMRRTGTEDECWSHSGARRGGEAHSISGWLYGGGNGLLRRMQRESFGEDIARLEKGKDVLKGSRLITLSPEFDHSTRLVRIGGRLPQFQTIGVHIFGRR